MNIIFFGEAYVKATKRKEDEKAKRYHNALLASERELKLEMAKAKQKKDEAEEKRLVKEREKKSATEQIALRGGGVKDVSMARDAISAGKEYFVSPEGAAADRPFLKPGGFGPARGGVRTARDPGKTFLEEAQPGKARLDVTDLSLRGKRTLPSAMERLQAGKSIIPTTAERALQQPGAYQPPAMTRAMQGEWQIGRAHV